MRLQEFPKDGPSELNENVLGLSQVAMTLLLGQDAKAYLHPLNVVPVGAHGRDLSFLLLMLFEEGADDEDSIDRHLLVRHAQIALRLHCKLGESDSEARRKVVVLGIH